ncbi:MAG: efflux RND transporter permease subunit [Limisphaerales bacterium]
MPTENTKDSPTAGRANPIPAGLRAGGGLVGVSIRQPVFTTMIMIGLMVVGYFSMQRLSTDEYPDVSFPVLSIQTAYLGASPEAIEQQVTRVIEQAVNTTQGIEKLTSKSLEGISLITIQFVLGTDISAATAEVRSKIEQVRRQMPPDIDPPVIQQVDINQQPILSMALSSRTRSIGDLTALADGDLRRALETVAGVGRVQISGGLKREIHVWLLPVRMHALDISADQVINALRQQNLDAPAGRIEHGNREYLVRVVGRIERPAEFANVIVAERGGLPVRLAEVATIEDTTEEQRSLALVDGRPAIGIDLMKVGGANTVEVARSARTAVDKLESSLPKDASLAIIRDNSVNIRDSVDAVKHELLTGALLTIAIVFLFLNDLRATAITSLALPVSVISTFIVLHLLHFTLNVMTLMALSLSIGLLVDDAIVVIESAVRHRAAGKDPFTAAFEGTQEIFLAVLASTLTIVAVFVPVAFMGGVIGKFFYQFGITIAWAILVSLFVSFTLTPMLSAWWAGPLRSAHADTVRSGKRTFIGRALHDFDVLFDRMARSYRGVVSWVLHHRITTLAIAALSFVGALALFPLIGGAFMPNQDASEFNVTFDTPSGSSFGYTRSKAVEVDGILRKLAEVKTTYITIGAGIMGTVNKGDVYVKLVPPKQRHQDQDAVMELARQALFRVYGATLSISKVSPLGGAQKPIQISITGPQSDVLGQLSQTIMAAVKKVPGAIEVQSSMGEPKPEIRLDVDVDHANDLQLDVATIAGSVQPLLAGQTATKWRDSAGRERNVIVRLPIGERATTEQIAQLPIRRAGAPSDNPDDNSVPLGQVANIRQSTGPSLIERENMARVATVEANVQGRALGDVSKDIMQAMKNISFPAGYFQNMGGDTQQLQETVGYVIQAILLAVILIYLILASQFGSFLQPLAIMFSVPLALIGVFLALLILRDTLNMMSMIGLIMLMGIVTKNAILLVDSANDQQRAGQDMWTALIHAGEVRLRPIVMTTMATIFGMLPIALGLGAGGAGRAPMARAVIGGLMTSTLLTLLVVPVIYSYLEEFSSWFRTRVLRTDRVAAGSQAR